jgi:antitoxin ParD1/3/4
MNIPLTPKLEKIVQDKVKSGLYTSSSEVIREGLCLLEERDRIRAEKLEALKREIALGIEQADRGEVDPWDINEIKADVAERLRQES